MHGMLKYLILLLCTGSRSAYHFKLQHHNNATTRNNAGMSLLYAGFYALNKIINGIIIIAGRLWAVYKG